MFQGLWPILQAVNTRYSASSQVAENVCRCYKHALRTGGPGMSVVLPLLAKTLVACFTSTPHSPYLYAGSICLTEFAADPQHAPMLLEMCQQMAARTFALLTSLGQVGSLMLLQQSISLDLNCSTCDVVVCFVLPDWAVSSRSTQTSSRSSFTCSRGL